MASSNERAFHAADGNRDGVVSKEEFAQWYGTRANSSSKFAPPPPITEPAQLPDTTGKPNLSETDAYYKAKNECSAKSSCGCSKETVTDGDVTRKNLAYIKDHGKLDFLEKSAAMRMKEKGYAEQYTKLRDTEASGCDAASIQAVIGTRFPASTMALAGRGDKIAIASIDPVWKQLQERCDNKLKYSDLSATSAAAPTGSVEANKEKRVDVAKMQKQIAEQQQRRNKWMNASPSPLTI